VSGAKESFVVQVRKAGVRAYQDALAAKPTLPKAQEWLETGFNVISYSTEMAVYMTAMTQAVQQVRALAAKG